MSNDSLAQTGRVAPAPQNLTPNERAIIDSIGIPILRNLFTAVWRVKLRLQFTGWLQYMIPAIVTLVFFLIAGLARLLGSTQAAIPFVFVGALLLAVLTFDLLTVKFRLHPHERLPKRNDDLELFDLMRARRSCRSFQTRKLTSADYDELMEYVRLHSEAPTIGKSPVRFEYVSAPLTVWPTVNATEFLVAIAPQRIRPPRRHRRGPQPAKDRHGCHTHGIGNVLDRTGRKPRQCHRGTWVTASIPGKTTSSACAPLGYNHGIIPLFLRIFNAQFRRRLAAFLALFRRFEIQGTFEPGSVPIQPIRAHLRDMPVGAIFLQWPNHALRCRHGEEWRRGEVEARLARFDFYAVTESRYYAPVAVGIWCANWEMGCEALGIPGHFAVLSAEERGIQEENARPQLPRYDVSWVLDERLV